MINDFKLVGHRFDEFATTLSAAHTICHPLALLGVQINFELTRGSATTSLHPALLAVALRAQNSAHYVRLYGLAKVQFVNSFRVFRSSHMDFGIDKASRCDRMSSRIGSAASCGAF